MHNGSTIQFQPLHRLEFHSFKETEVVKVTWGKMARFAMRTVLPFFMAVFALFFVGSSLWLGAKVQPKLAPLEIEFATVAQRSCTVPGDEDRSVECDGEITRVVQQRDQFLAERSCVIAKVFGRPWRVVSVSADAIMPVFGGWVVCNPLSK